MAKNVKIHGVVYNEVKGLQAPLADDSGEMAYFPDTSDADVAAENMESGKIGYANGKKVAGTMPVHGAGGGTISEKNGTVSIPKGSYDGTGKVAIADTEKEKLISENIRKGITILGVEGGMSTTEGANPQAKSVTPTKSKQVILPDSGSGYNYLSQVTIEPIPDEYINTNGATAEAEHITKGETAFVNGKMVTGTHTDPTFTLASGVLSIS